MRSRRRHTNNKNPILGKGEKLKNFDDSFTFLEIRDQAVTTVSRFINLEFKI